jgi:tRNA threonylcarbamoyladenosine biosynthesis protein TsaE
MIYRVTSDVETAEIGRNLAEKLTKLGIKRAYIAMRGEMGVGKTAFTRGFASHFGIRGVKSPTYSVVNEYRGRKNVFHFDMYRIESEDDLLSVGYDDYLAQDGYCIAEWSENITEFLPIDTITVEISRCQDNENGRVIEVMGLGDCDE